MKKMILLQMLMLSAVCVIAENHRQQTEFELSEQLQGQESYRFEASSYIKLLDGFRCDPVSNYSSCFVINRYGVFPPEAGFLGGPTPTYSDGVVGALPGTLSVSDIGCAMYSIPIQLPKGIGDMTPDLAITYNNQSGNGLLGWAWNLSGLSSITRVGTTKYHDGVAGKIKFNNDDRFVLDGKRLLLNCQLQYGGNGATYRTEFDDMSKIVSHTSNSQNGPEYFTVYKPDGTIWEYGSSADSYILPQNGYGPAMSWLVSKISDRDGNSIVFHYDNNNSEGEYYVSFIEYTLNETYGINSMYEVSFSYESRTDNEVHYVYQNAVKIKRILKEIQVKDKSSDKELLRYTFDYLAPGKYDWVNFNYNRLKSINLVADGMKLNPTVVTWNDKKKHFNEKFQSHTLDGDVFDKVPFVGDFNGDGFSDVLLVPYKNGDSYLENVTAEVYINNADGTFESTPRYTFVFDKTLEWVYVVDFDGDGLSDIVPYFCNYEANSSWRSKAMFYINNGDVSFSKIGNDLSYDRFFNLYPGDFCGENRTSFYFVYNNEGSSGTYYPCIVYYKNGAPYQQTLEAVSYEYVPKDVVVLDMDGDGKQEVMYITDDKAVAANLRYSDGFYNYVLKFIYDGIDSEDFLFPGDFNGDGNVDLLKYNHRNYWSVVMSDGKQFLPSVSCLQSQLLNGLTLSPQDKYSCFLSQLSTPLVTIRTADFDGDGKCDVSVFKSSGGNSYMTLGSYMYQKASGEYDFKNTERFYLGTNNKHNNIFVGNFFGRENQSILSSVYHTSSPSYYDPKTVILNSQSAMYSVERITDGVGNVHGFAYDYLMPRKDNSIYSFDLEWINSDIRTICFPVMALKSDTVFTTNGARCYKNYSYENIWYHTGGRGLLGTEYNSICTYINGKQTQRKFVEFELDMTNGPAMALPSMIKIFDSDDMIIGMETFAYEKFVCADNSKIVMPLQTLNKKISFNLDGNTDVIKVELTDNEYISDANGNTYNDFVNLKKTTTGTDKKDKGDDVGLYNYQTCKEYTYNNNVNLWVVNRIKNVKCSQFSQNGSHIGNCESFVYDNTTNPFRVIKKTTMPNLIWNDYDPLTITTNYEYDIVGNIVGQVQSSPSASSRSSRAEYSNDYSYRFPTAFVNEKGWRTSMRYSDCFGLAASTVDYNDFEMNTADDILGVTSVCAMADGVEIIKTKRWANGQKHAPANAMYYCWEKSTGKAESMVFYHKNGNQLRNVTFDLNGEAIYVDMTYDDNGNMSARSLPYRDGENVDYVYFIYDKHNRIIEEIFPNGLRHEYSYDKYSKTMTTIATDGNVQIKTEVTNEMGWVVETVDIGGNKLTFDYYSDGLLKSSQIGNNTATKVSFEYDHLRNKSKIEDPSSGTIRYEYDAFGNLLKTITPQNEIITCGYDPSGLLVSREINNGSGDVVETQWVYDNAKGRKGMLRHVSHGKSHTTDYSYDDLLRLASVTETIDGVSYETTYEYDQAGRESRKTYPSGYEIENHYSNSGFLNSISDVDSDVVLWKTNDTDAMGNVTDYQLGNGLQTQLGYDDDFKYLKSIYTFNDKKVFQNLTYLYDEFGNLTNRSKHSGTMASESFEYDSFNRLVEIRLNGNTTGSMVYDEFGNMTGKTINGVSVFYEGEYNGTDPYAIQSAKTELDDLNGLSQKCAYTAFGKLQDASNDYASIRFGYDADLNRDKMSVFCDGVTTSKTYVGDCEFVEKNNVTAAFTFLSGPMGVFAVVYDGNGAKRSVFYIHKDHLDSWCLITDEDSNVVQETSYDAWGNPRNAATWNGEYKGELLCDRGFTGHEHILVLGLINMNGRVYDPMMSMMLSPDNFIQNRNFSQNYNRYRYCYNNPLSYNDPSGEIAQWILEGIFWGAVNVIANLDVIDDFWEGALLFAAGFASGSLTHGLSSCSWVVQVVCGVGGRVVQAGVNNFVSQNDGSYDWDAIDKSSLKEDVMYAVGYGLASSTLNAYIVAPSDENTGVCIGTLICEDFKRGHILETTVASFVGNFFAQREPLESIDWASLGIEWSTTIPSVLNALQDYYPDDTLLSLINGMYDVWGFISGFFGGQNGNNGGTDNGSMMNAIRFDSPMICRANLDSPACYSNVRSLILNK